VGKVLVYEGEKKRINFGHKKPCCARCETNCHEILPLVKDRFLLDEKEQ
jgi:hypothetical protein